MNSPGPGPMEVATAEIPEHFYETSMLRSMMPAAIGGMVVGYVYEFRGPEIPQLLNSALAAAAYITASLLDRRSSRRIQANVDELHSLGIEANIAESNSFLLGKVTNSEELDRALKSKMTLAFESVLGLMASLSVATVLPVVCGRGMAILNNSRKVQRTKRALELANQ